MQTNNIRVSALHVVMAILLLVSLGAIYGCNRPGGLSDSQHMERAKTFREQSNRESEIIELKNVLQKNPNHPEAHWRLGEAYAELGYGSEGEKELVRAKALGIDAEVIKVALGKALLDQGSYAKVLEGIQAGPQSSATNVAAIKTLRGEAELGLRKYETGCAMFTEAQASDPNYVPAYWGAARCAAGFGKLGEADALLDKAIKLDGKNSGTWLRRGDLWRDQQKFKEAEQAYTSGLGFHPEHLPTLFARAAIRLQLGNQDGVQEDLDSANKRVKNHPLAQHLKGVLLYKQSKYVEAKTTFESVLNSNPNYAPTILWLGLTDYALKNWEQAAKGLRRYVEAVPSATQVQAILALINARLGGKQAAAESLAVLGKINIEDPQSLVMIGQAHLLMGDADSGARYLTRAVEKNPDALNPRIDLATALLQKGDIQGATGQAEEAFKKDPSNERAAAMLIATLLKAKQTDRAIQVATELQKNLPNSPTPYQYRAAIKAEANDLDGAKVDLEQSLKVEPGNVVAGHALATLAIRRNDLPEARRLYQQVRDKHGDSLLTLMALYDLEISAKDLSAARKAVETAAAKYPSAARPSRIMASAYLRMQNPGKALEVTNAAAAANPDDIELLQVRGAAYLEKGDVGNALTSYHHLVKLKPNIAEAHMRLAQAQLNNNDVAAGRKSLQQVLKLDAHHALAKLTLARLYMADQKFDEAVRITQEVQKETPNLLDAYFLHAGALEGQKHKAEALGVLERVQKAYPESDVALIELAKFQFNAGARDKAFAMVKTWLKDHLDNVAVTAFLAESLMAENQESEAVAVYENLLAKLPGNVVVLNNLANLLMSSSPQRALDYAAQAHQAELDNPRVADTYGWLLLRTGDKKQSLTLIKQAFDALPNLPEVHYHYAAALAESGETAQAKRELEKLLNSERKFSVRNQAELLLKRL